MRNAVLAVHYSDCLQVGGNQLLLRSPGRVSGFANFVVAAGN